MILPVPPEVKIKDLMDTYPWTITLLFLNIFFFGVLFYKAPGAEKLADLKKESEVSNEFIQRAGRFYLEWNKQPYVGKQKLEIQALGAQAVRDSDFILNLDKWNSKIDPVGYESWKKDFEVVFNQKENKAIHIFGLSQVVNNPLTWITYQFSHQGGLHLFSNMLLMIFFAAIVERMLGGFLMGVIYILGGLVGASFFMNMESSGLIPMVGASASVTGLMGFVAAGSLRKNIEYFYFLAPFQGFFGRVYLSPLWIISMFLLSDITELLSDPPGWGGGGVAHSAHLGGAFAGLILGLAYKYGVMKSAAAPEVKN